MTRFFDPKIKSIKNRLSRILGEQTVFYYPIAYSGFSKRAVLAPQPPQNSCPGESFAPQSLQEAGCRTLINRFSEIEVLAYARVSRFFFFSRAVTYSTVPTAP